MENKIKCWKCNIEKPLNEFHNSKRDKEFGKHRKCKSCAKEYALQNKDKIKIYNKENYNPQKSIQRVYEWRVKKYGDKVKEREERNNIKNEIKEQKKQIAIYKKTVLIPLKKSVRTSLWLVFKNKKFPKNGNSQGLLGCDYEFLKEHIEKQFLKGMNWENKELWHIDHIIPLASANDKDELIRLCHYSNIQPMWAEENYKKRGKIPLVTNLHFINLHS